LAPRQSIDVGADDQAEEQVWDELGGGGDGEVERRTGQDEHHERK
jgi:hypothetical protein